MPLRSQIVAILVIVAVPLALMLYDSRYNSFTYRCDAPSKHRLAPNSPGGVHGAELELELEGLVTGGNVSITILPDFPSLGFSSPHVFTSGASISFDYAGEIYEPIEVIFVPEAGAECDLRISYRLASDVSVLNPLW